MENASKALIIAGAILLSILIIGLGMFIYQQAANAMGKINLNEQQVQTINSKFTNYGTEGTKINGTTARALCETVKSYNRQSAEDESQYVVVTSGTGPNTTINTGDLTTVNGNIDTVESSLKAGKTYTLHFGYDAESALIIGISLEG